MTSPRAWLVAAMWLVVSAASPVWAQSGSVSYLLQQSSINAAGGTGSSAGYVLDGSAGEQPAVATSASVHYVLQSGLWSFVGPGLAAVMLDVTNVAGAREDPVLAWTGNGSTYSIYRSAACGDVFSGFLTEQTGQTYTDGDAPPVALVCYKVIAEPAVLLRQPGGDR